MQHASEGYAKPEKPSSPRAEASDALKQVEITLRMQLARVSYLERNLIAARNYRDALVEEYRVALVRSGRGGLA
jgi:hypothetical protein